MTREVIPCLAFMTLECGGYPEHLGDPRTSLVHAILASSTQNTPDASSCRLQCLHTALWWYSARPAPAGFHPGVAGSFLLAHTSPCPFP
jgi:hypothetical protein